MSSSLGAIGSLPGKLRSLLVSSKNQLPDPLKDEVKLLIQDLEEACNLLVDLSGVEPPESLVKLWRNEVREMSYDLEDYIDKTTHPYSNQFEVEEFGTLVDLARDACKSYHRYHLGHLWPPNPSSLASGHGLVPRLNMEATYIVGIEDARHKLISRLRDDAEQQLKVVPILGPAGVGKTTLAQEVYREIGGEYHCRAFVRASRMPDTRRLLRSIISQVQHRQRPPYGCTVQKLIDCLSEYLQHKRYFIVIDGLCETTSWDIVNSAFPRSTYCSRILITTDIEDVAFMCSDHQSDDVFLMEPLSRDYSAELLSNRLSGYKPELFEQLEENLEDIIRTCGGLPLSIISMAHILASQPYNSQLWFQVKGCLSSRLRNNLTSEGMLKEIVGLSYDCLSHDRKICLLYLSLYPEGYAFFKADLLKQWTAEGFMSGIQENGNDVAESYFDELVCRGLIEPNHIIFSDTSVSYTVHSTLFEVIRYKSTDENFTTVIDYSNTISELSANVRRLSLRYSNAKYAAKPEGIPLSPVRSLIFYGLVECMPSVTDFEVLRVLNLEFWGDQEELDLSGISQLFQLSYVRITTDIAVKLPAKMNELKYLETLEIYARVTSVPQDIVHLPSLLHLCLHGEVKLSDGINHMRSLRTLKYFDLSSNSEDNVSCLGQMTDLHDLHLTCFKAMPDPLERNLIALASSMGKLGKLKSFVLAPDTSCSSIYSDCTSNISSLPTCLQRLELLPPICIFLRIPKCIGRLRELRIMKIVVRQLTRDDVDSIAELQKLIVFSLCVRQPSAETIVFKRAAFPVLKYFKFRCGVLHLAFQAETMPSLQKLKLEFNAHSGDQYDDMLTGIENLLNIQVVAGRIGTVPGAEESDRTGAEAAFEDAIIKHSKVLAINVRRVDWVEEEICQLLDLREDSNSSDMASGNSSGKCLESQQSLANIIPKELPAHFMKETTSDLSPERVHGRSAFGKVPKGTLAEGGMISVKSLADNSPVKQGEIFLAESTALPVEAEPKMFGNIGKIPVIGDLTGSNKNAHLKGNVVLMRKTVLGFDVTSMASAVIDGVGEFLGRGVTCQLISSTVVDPNNGNRGKVGTEASLEQWLLNPPPLLSGENQFRVTFDWEVEKHGVPGAIIVKNNHASEFFLKTITIDDVPGHGTIVFVANSWIYPQYKYRYNRVFFSNDTYLPSQMPAALKPYRDDELRNLRGDDQQGPYQEHDRVYRYDVYNDLGNPDGGNPRPVLGGSNDHPYPRRGRTGRKMTQTDPSSESRLTLTDGDVYVPRDERFGHIKNTDFYGYTIKAFADGLVPILQGYFLGLEFNSFKDILQLYEGGIKLPDIPALEEFRKQFPLQMVKELMPAGGDFVLKLPMPKIIKEDKKAWMSDDEFARETLAGVNPLIIRRLAEFPPKSTLDPSKYGDQTSTITEAHIAGSLEGLTVQQALDSKRLYILDHHDHYMPYLIEVNSLDDNFIYATRTLLFLRGNGTLAPVAIEMSLPELQDGITAAKSTVYTPVPPTAGVEAWVWRLAKAYVNVNDYCWHQGISHWLNTHAVMEPFIIATNRQLSVTHPVHRLLLPHYRNTMNINALARQKLINAGGIFEMTVFPRKYAIEISSKVYGSWNFAEQALPVDLIVRGMAVPDPSSPYKVRLLIEDYPYASDGLAVWHAIEQWVTEYLAIYYPNDGVLQSDVELQAWWKEAREVGHADLKDKPWWRKMQTVPELVQACTTIIWIASALHAAVNFGQYPYCGYHPNRPSVSRRPMPVPGSDEYKELEKNPEKFFVRSITTQFQAVVSISLLEILSSHSSDEVYLGQRDTKEWTSDAKAQEAFKRFGARLIEIEKRVEAMNKDPRYKNRYSEAQFPYTLLFPNTSDKKGDNAGVTAKGIPNSISI